MEIKSAEFGSSYTSYKDCPDLDLPEYAFVGRSNVGKSSLINMLLNKKDLAKTSQSPGKTQLINQFIINSNWVLTDLPGYGFAKVAKSKRKDFNKLINEYTLFRKNLYCLFVLIDIRHEPQKNDMEFMRWLGENQVPFVMIFTKSDKISSSVLKLNVEKYKKRMLKEWEELPDIFITSSKEKTGKDKILNYIEKINNTNIK